MTFTDIKEYHRNLTKELSRFDFKEFELLFFRGALLTTAITLTSKKEILTGRLLLMDIKNATVTSLLLAV